MPATDSPKYWFPGKRYGWGWGPPTAWQGWVVVVACVALVLGGIPLVHVRMGSVVYNAYVAVLTVALLVLCWLTGENPRWRSGKRDA